MNRKGQVQDRRRIESFDGMLVEHLVDQLRSKAEGLQDAYLDVQADYGYYDEKSYEYFVVGWRDMTQEEIDQAAHKAKLERQRYQAKAKKAKDKRREDYIKLREEFAGENI